MYDLVAYRIKYTPHPHAGSGWCIYPAYDWTHGICDSIEHIDYSICTLEFETRREPYYWILWALDMFRPAVYEMSRLNLEYTVLSKRRLIKLVDSQYVRGWDDPRMPTVSGYRRRGFTADIINTFCTDLGATRAANVIEMEKLFTTARTILSDRTQRAMAVLSPILVSITNWERTEPFVVQNSPTDPSMGSHTIELTSTLYIDSSDFRMQDDPDYYGLAPHKAVGLKYYGGNLICDDVVWEGDVVKELKCRIDHSDGRPKPKTYISWIPAPTSIPCEIRVYHHLFTVPEPSDLWEEELNPESEVVYQNAFVDPSVRDLVDVSRIDKWSSNQALQFERMGYFVVDLDSTYQSQTGQGRLVFNRTVGLKEEVLKKKATNALSKKEEEVNEARKLKQKADLEAKEARMKLSAQDLFRYAEEYRGMFSQFDEETGLPTHDADGTELTKSAMKKLKKEQDKHVKQLAHWKKQG
jgi:glutaminyl-tRNA synthetase